MRRIYMDHNATTSLHPAVIEEMEPFLRTRFGNPSSLHWAGRQVRPAIDQARERVARLVNCDPAEVVFTSCATESNNTAIKGVTAALRERGNHLITTTVEHPAVLTPCLYLEFFGFRVTCLEVDENGMLDPAALEAAIDERTILISAMYANNETGVIFPVERIGEVAARRKVVFHCDAAQAVGKIPIDFRAANIDLMSLSGHKLYAPKGVGALIVRRGVKLHPLLHGGSQEGNRRAGTENVAGIVGLGKACEVAGKSLAGEAGRLSSLRDRLEGGILETIPDVRRNGSPDQRLPNTANLSVLGVDSGTLLEELDRAGVAASSSSACKSGTVKTSHVLQAMGAAAGTAVGTVRFSLGRENSQEDVDYLLEVFPGIVRRLRQKSANL
jgi:cysteine desulfurase